MDKHELLKTLKDEALLAEARALGAKNAFSGEFTRQARDDINLWGDRHKVSVRYSDCTMIAIYAGVQMEPYDNEPTLFGWEVLPTGKRSRVKRRLGTYSQWKAGIIKLIPPTADEHERGNDSTEAPHPKDHGKCHVGMPPRA